MEAIDIPNEVRRQLINDAKEYASETNRSIIINNPDKYKTFRAGQDSGIKILSLQKQQDKAIIAECKAKLELIRKLVDDGTVSHTKDRIFTICSELINKIS